MASVFGKAGRAETATDPAPLSMFETTIILKPKSEWRPGLTWDDLIADLDERLRYPGMPNLWWQPIQTRTEMLSTGIRAPVGIQLYGDDLEVLEKTALEVEQVVKQVEGTRSASAERATGGFYLDVDVDRAAAARWGLTVADVHEAVGTAVGGKVVAETVQGRERYGIRVRYAHELRDTPEALAEVRVDTPLGTPVSLSDVAKLEFRSGPPMLRSEAGKLAVAVFIDTSRPVPEWVDDARPLVEREIQLPKGVRLEWTGQFKAYERAQQRLMLAVPATLLLVCLLLYFATRSWIETGIVLLAVPFSLIGAVWLLWALDFNLSVAVWVGLIALMGLDAETGVIMLLYLTMSHRRAKEEGKLRDFGELTEAIVDGAAKRIRPKLMTVLTTVIGLLPIIWSTGAGADVAKRIAAPMVGGVGTSFLLELLVYPAIFAVWKGRDCRRAQPRTSRRCRRALPRTPWRAEAGASAAPVAQRAAGVAQRDLLRSPPCACSSPVSWPSPWPAAVNGPAPHFPTGALTPEAGERCSTSAECPIGHACLGCSAEDARCLPGCQEDDDCPSGTCAQVACITCPCPSECE